MSVHLRGVKPAVSADREPLTKAPKTPAYFSTYARDECRRIVPVLIAIALALVVFGPALNRWAATQHAESLSPGRWVALVLGILLAGVYGGYFGAAQGVLMLGFLGLLLTEGIQRLNALKNLLVGITNLVAAVVFAFTTDVRWGIAGLVAVGAVGGGLLGAKIGRRLPPAVLRGCIVVIGVVCGLVIAVLGETTWRLGALVIGASLGVGAVERIALPSGEAGLLQVRSKVFDVVVLMVMAATIIVLAIVVPPGR